MTDKKYENETYRKMLTIDNVECCNFENAPFYYNHNQLHRYMK